MVKVCSSCGEQIQDDSVSFCPKCGQSLVVNQGPSQAVGQTPIQAPVQDMNQTVGQAPNQAPVQDMNQTVNQTPIQAPVQDMNQTVGQAPNQAPVQGYKSGLLTASKVLMIVSCISIGWTLIPLAWLIPMTCKIYKRETVNEPLSTGFKVCTLLFGSAIAGILLLCDDKA